MIGNMNMNGLILCFLLTVGSTGRAVSAGLKEVRFEWFNLSTNEIWVTEIAGIPPDASPGRLTSNKAEIPRERSESILAETVHIKDRITIIWRENGAKGWPGGLNPPGSTPPGISHQAEIKRSDAGIPAKLRTGKIRFTYLGADRWRVRFFANPDAGYDEPPAK